MSGDNVTINGREYPRALLEGISPCSTSSNLSGMQGDIADTSGVCEGGLHLGFLLGDLADDYAEYRRVLGEVNPRQLNVRVEGNVGLADDENTVLGALVADDMIDSWGWITCDKLEGALKTYGYDADDIALTVSDMKCVVNNVKRFHDKAPITSNAYGERILGMSRSDIEAEYPTHFSYAYCDSLFNDDLSTQCVRFLVATMETEATSQCGATKTRACIDNQMGIIQTDFENGVYPMFDALPAIAIAGSQLNAVFNSFVNFGNAFVDGFKEEQEDSLASEISSLPPMQQAIVSGLTNSNFSDGLNVVNFREDDTPDAPVRWLITLSLNEGQSADSAIQAITGAFSDRENYHVAILSQNGGPIRDHGIPAENKLTIAGAYAGFAVGNGISLLITPTDFDLTNEATVREQFNKVVAGK